MEDYSVKLAIHYRQTLSGIMDKLTTEDLTLLLDIFKNNRDSREVVVDVIKEIIKHRPSQLSKYIPFDTYKDDEISEYITSNDRANRMQKLALMNNG